MVKQLGKVSCLLRQQDPTRFASLPSHRLSMMTSLSVGNNIERLLLYALFLGLSLSSSVVAAPRTKSPPTPGPKKQSTPNPKQQPPANYAGAETKVAIAVELPDQSKTDPVTLMTIADGEATIDILNPIGNPLTFRAVVDTPNQTWTVTDGTRKIARLARKDGKLNLFWETGAPNDAECLRNAVLKITSGSDAKLVELRTPGAIDSPFVDLSKAKWIIPADMPLWGLAHKSLKIEATGMVDNKPAVEAFFPANRRANFGGKVRVVVRNKTPHAGVQLSLMATEDRSSIKIEPLIIDFNDNPQPWTLDRIAALCKSHAKAIGTQTAGIPAARNAIPQLKSQIATLKRNYNPNSITAFSISVDVMNLTETLSKTEAKLATWEAALPVNKQRLEALQVLQAFGTEVHQKARLTFRVFYVADGHEVTVLTARPSGSPGERSASTGATLTGIPTR